MAIDVAVVREGLPRGGTVLPDETIEPLISAWEYRIEKVAGAEWKDNPLADEVVRLGVTGAAREMADAKSGLSESPVGKEQQARAEKLIEVLDKATTSEGEQPDDDGGGGLDQEPEGEVDETLISNMDGAPMLDQGDPYFPGPGQWYPYR
jgi:hypothetical protein